jgi:ElaB/YqjD/DUF883 family membrane-anchored ribosome-binding protein
VEHSGVRWKSQSFAATGGQVEDGPRGESSRSGSSMSDSVARGKQALGGAATEAMNSAGSDLQSLRADLNGLKDTLATFMSRAGSEAANSTREVMSNAANQVGGVASDLVGKGAEMASAASNQAKSFASELAVIRSGRWPAVAVGVLIGLLGRRR